MAAAKSENCGTCNLDTGWVGYSGLGTSFKAAQCQCKWCPPFDCCSAVAKPFGRSIAGLFRGWHDGGVDYRSCQDQFLARDLANFRDALQSDEEGFARDCAGIERRGHCGRIDHALWKTGKNYGATAQRANR